MAEPAGSGYRSPLNLGLDQMPKAVDVNLFQEMVPVYNAIHTLNAYLDRLRLSLEGGDPDKPLDEEMRFVRGLWLPAGEDITAGSVITFNSSGLALKGCGKRAQNIAGHRVVDCMMTGIAMTDALEEEKVRMGIGPAILNVPGFTPKQFVWAQPPGYDFSGLMLPEQVDGALRIGHCVVKDFIMIFPDYLNLDWTGV